MVESSGSVYRNLGTTKAAATMQRGGAQHQKIRPIRDRVLSDGVSNYVGNLRPAFWVAPEILSKEEAAEERETG
jgi:hypothetical protein